MYAILETGGKQYRVQPGDTISVERLPAEPGETLELGSVLLLAGDGERTRVGAPSVPGAIVRAEVVEHGRGDKIIVFRFKSKVRYRRKTGHRQALTRLRITDILLDGKSTAAEPAEAPVDVQTQEEVAPAAPARRRRAAAPAVEPEATEVSEAPEATAAEAAAPEE
jgi:large subunit ribosomal protein L21